MNFAVVGSDLDLLDDLSFSGQKVAGYFSLENKQNGFTYLGDHNEIGNLENSVKVLLAIDDINLRKFLFIKHNSQIGTYVSTNALVSKTSQIGLGSVIYPNAYISGQVRIAECVKISVGVQLHHEVNFGMYSIAAPGATILGRAEIEDSVFLGARSVIGPNMLVGSNVTIGMGAVVTRDVEANSISWGVPAKIVKKI